MDFEPTIVDLQDKPADFVETYSLGNPNPTARAKVPVLEMESGQVLVESLVIVEYLADHFKDQGTALLPPDAMTRAVCRLWNDVASPFSSYITLLRAKDDPEALEKAIDDFKLGLSGMDQFLKTRSTDTSPFLCDEFTIAEAATAPFVCRACANLPHFLGPRADPMVLCQEGGLDRLSSWIEAVRSRSSVVNTMVSPEEMVESAEKFMARLAAMNGSPK